MAMRTSVAVLVGAVALMVLSAASGSPSSPPLFPSAVAFSDRLHGELGLASPHCDGCRPRGAIAVTSDGGKTWRDVSHGLMGAGVRNIVASKERTFILHAQTDRGVMISRDGGMSWRPAAESDKPEFKSPAFKEWQRVSDKLAVRVNEAGELVQTTDEGKTSSPFMSGWRIPRASSVFITRWGVIASGPGGCYRSTDGDKWTELKLWRDK